MSAESSVLLAGAISSLLRVDPRLVITTHDCGTTYLAAQQLGSHLIVGRGPNVIAAITALCESVPEDISGMRGDK